MHVIENSLYSERRNEYKTTNNVLMYFYVILKYLFLSVLQNYSFKRIIYDGFTKNTVRIIVIDTFDSMLNR